LCSQLHEQGLLELEDPICKFIPEFANMRVLPSGQAEPVPAKCQMTIKHLLTHTSGVRRPPFWTNERTPVSSSGSYSLQLCEQRCSVSLVFLVVVVESSPFVSLPFFFFLGGGVAYLWHLRGRRRGSSIQRARHPFFWRGFLYTRASSSHTDVVFHRPQRLSLFLFSEKGSLEEKVRALAQLPLLFHPGVSAYK
jgi:hypothetical protein